MPGYVIGNFFAYSIINAFTPGPGNILALNTVTNYGWKKGKCSQQTGRKPLGVQDGYMRNFQPMENLRGLSVTDTRGLRRMSKSSIKKVHELMMSCEVIIAAFEAGNVKYPKVWDMLEGFPSKRMVFLVTKCDLVSEKELETNIDKLKCYMQESGIKAPVFAVSILEENGNDRNIISIDAVRLYIRESLMGQHPILAKQMQNVENARKLLMQLHSSFALRQQLLLQCLCCC